MTQPTHTHAPWTYNPIPQMGYYNIEDSKGNIIGRFASETDAIKATAAHELLEALENSVEVITAWANKLTSDGVKCSELKKTSAKINKAIAKARG